MNTNHNTNLARVPGLASGFIGCGSHVPTCRVDMRMSCRTRGEAMVLKVAQSPWDFNLSNTNILASMAEELSSARAHAPLLHGRYKSHVTTAEARTLSSP